MEKLIECVPNFSEGRDMNIINAIVAAIGSAEGVKVLNVDPGAATNRTVVTFIGGPEAVVEGAFRGVAKAQELIDMRHHTGEHPRIGATDVLPLVPVAGVTMEEAAELARGLAERVGTELGIPVYCYESAAFEEKRRNLASCRAGEYEGLEKKLADPAWRPDYGPAEYTESVARSGASVIGARDFLLAVNFNLNTTSTRRANAIAFDVREKGRPKREGGSPVGKKIVDAEGNVVMIPGTLKGTKAIGWYIEEYGIAQVSMNIVDMNSTPLHIAYEEVCRKAEARGVRVTGCEVVGLLPRKVLIDAGRYYLKLQRRSTGVSEEELVKIAVRSMSLSDLAPFKPEERVIEYLIADRSPKLVDMTCKAFAVETASESPAPGGGSVSAYMGALGAALATMVANLSSHKAGWDDRWEYFSDMADKGAAVMTELLALVDEDTAAFNRIMDVFAMPKETAEEKQARREALERATLYATEVPLRTMKTAVRAFEVIEAMIKEGNPNSVSDAGVGALAVRAAVQGAFLNVKINAAGLKDREKAGDLVGEATILAAETDKREEALLEMVEDKIKGA
ncbi:MAG: glutamate formimidoyltransferase [Rikenellaceae bacterium]|nr:glutamate formimidoyltransferase [Rikenellaceae bacterium]